MYRKMTDGELLCQFAECKDIRAFREIYDRFWPVLYSHAKSMLDDTDLASDVVQDVFMRIWDKGRELKDVKSLSGYLYSTVTHKVLDHFDHQKVWEKYQKFQQYTILHFSSHSAHEEVIAKELKQIIESEVRQLPPKMREAFELSREQELSYKEIASRMGASEETIRKQIHTVLKRLRSRLPPFIIFLLF